MTVSSSRTIELPAESGVQEAAIVPPHDLDAEASVISAVLLDPTALGRVEDFLLPTHFYSEAHRRLFEAAIAVALTGSAVDAQTVSSRLKETGRLAQIGGMPYIGLILDATPAPGNVRDHAKTVFERWRVRQGILVCERASTFGYGVVDVQAYLESVARGITELAQQRPDAAIERNFEVLRGLVRRLRASADVKPGEQAKERGILTGIRSLDEKTLGLFAGQKTTIVAPPRVGKTALALQIAINVASLGIGVAFFSTEMTREELAIRQLAYLANVDSWRIQQALQNPKLSAEEWQRIAMAMSKVEDLRPVLHVIDEPSQSVDEICSKAKAIQDKSMVVDGVPLGLVVVDYVQNLIPPARMANEKAHVQVKYSTTRLKTLAAKLKVPVIELAQSKNSEVEKGKSARPRPQLGDAAECFYIERSANNVIHLWRPEERNGSHVKAVCVKQRGGGEWDLDLRFQQDISRFDDLPYGPMTSPARQYADDPPEPPPGRFDDDDHDLTKGL